MKLLDQAQIYLDRGFSIIPQRLFLKPEGKVGKLPPKGLSWKKYQKERVSKTHLLTKWKNYLKGGEGCGVAIITGEISGIMVVDIDDTKAEGIVQKFLPPGFKTVTVRTGSGGWHLYFRYKPGLKTTAGLGDSGLDIRTDGGYVVAPGSCFPKDWEPGDKKGDGRYIFWKGRGLDEVDINEIPAALFEHLVDLINRYDQGTGAGHGGKRDGSGKKKEGHWYQEDLKGVAEGTRTLSLTRICGMLKRQRVPREVAWDLIQGWNQLNQPPEDGKELELQFKSIWKNVVEKENVGILDQINDHYSVITSGNNVRIMYEDEWEELHFFTVSDFGLRFKNQRIPWGNKTVSVSDLWLEWQDRKTYEKCVFDPNNQHENCYNLWKGFSITGKAGDWSLFRKHIEENLAGEHTEWVLKWMARIIQDPGGERPGTTLVLRGRQGTGKGVFANHFGVLLGDHFTVVNNMNHVTGRFNKDLANTLLLYIDEATWGGDKTTAGQLKNLITEPKRRIEAKNIDAIYVENHLNLIISSNNDWLVPAGPMERRFMVMDVSDAHIQDKAYFRAIINQLRHGGYEAMMYDLQKMEYDLDELREIPKTGGTRDQIIKGMDLIESFWYGRLCDGRLVDAHEFWKYRVVTDKLYQQYEDFCVKRNANRSIDHKVIFIKKLRRLCPSMDAKKVRHDGNGFYCTILPDLDTCRKEFDIFISGKPMDGWPPIIEPDNVQDVDRHKDLPGSFRKFVEGPPPF